MNTPFVLRALVAACALLVAAGRADGQQASNIAPAASFAWSENAGWLNFHDGGVPAAGATAHLRWLEGQVWAENLGWIALGDGTPANGLAYANVDASDFGVNVDPLTGFLSGLAWSENAGWIVFDTAALGPNQRAQFDFCAHVMSGWAWGENVGWINLQSESSEVRVVDPTVDLGFALGTLTGFPDFCGFGHTSTGDNWVLRLRANVAGAFSIWFIGLTPNPTPFKGGLLVPVPILTSLSFVTGPGGLIALEVPGGTGLPAPVDVILQCAIADPAGPAGVTLSNALRIALAP